MTEVQNDGIMYQNRFLRLQAWFDLYIWSLIATTSLTEIRFKNEVCSDLNEELIAIVKLYLTYLL